jgi:hypothetical protein
MKASECVQVLELHQKLLACYEPQQAVLWLVTRNKTLEGRRPCEVLGEVGGYTRIVQLIAITTLANETYSQA